MGFDIEPINIDISDYEISLFTPNVSIATGNVFSNLKSYNKYSLDEAIQNLTSKNFDNFVKGLKNDLQDTAFELYPEVKARFELLKKVHGEKGLFMTGSGSTLVKISKR